MNNYPPSKDLEFLEFPVIEPLRRVQYYVPSEFTNRIILHCIKSTARDLRSALILAIQGDSGQGKTFQCLESFSQIGVYVVLVSGFNLSGRFEGEPVRKMQEVYAFALDNQNRHRRPTAILIDDFDNSIASVRSYGHGGYSVNTQLLIDFFMNLPSSIPVDSKPVPIVITGNNFTDLYQPLVRYGRISFYDWTGPNRSDKVEIVKTILSSIIKDADRLRLETVVERFHDQSIAFFNELKNSICDEKILSMAHNGNNGVDLEAIHLRLREGNFKASVADLLEHGDRLLQNRPKNFLNADKPGVGEQ